MYLNIKLKYTFLSIFLSSSYFSIGQFLHTPEEMEAIIQNNPEKYIIQETNNLGTEAFINCRQEKNTPRPKTVLTILDLDHQKLSKLDKKKLKKRNKKITSQLSKSDNTALSHELYKNHYQLGNFEEALFYKLQFEDIQAFSFENELFLAKAFLEIGELDVAFEHIFNAKILLPYSEHTYTSNEIQQVEKLMRQILIANNKSYQDWALQFSYCISNRDNKTFISFKSQPWKTYAICKSVWQEDEPHKTKMATISDQASWEVEEKECLLNALVSYLRHEENNPEFMGLQQLALALEHNYISDFIRYETYTSRYLPLPSGQPNREEIKALKSYFLRVHTTSSN